jgi:hypothetical protein
LPERRCETDSARAENMSDTQKQIVTVGVTGASGAILAQKTLALLEEDTRVAHVHFVVTEAGQRLFTEELGITSGDLKQLPSRMLGHPVGKIEIPWWSFRARWGRWARLPTASATIWSRERRT